MDKALLDTDILSEVMRAKNSAVVQRAQAYHATHGRLTVSVITVMEITKGLHKLQRDMALRRFLDGLAVAEVLEFSLTAAELAGRIYGDLEQTGQPIGRADPMIAAIALEHGLTLVSGNVSHYQRIQALGYGLRLENWR